MFGIVDVPFPKYTITEYLGTGGTGMIYEAEQLSDRTLPPIVAIKRIPLSVKERERNDDIIKMHDLMKNVLNLKHVNILRHFAFTVEPPSSKEHPYYFTIMTEFCNGGTLTDRAKEGLSVLWIHHYARQLLDAIHYLHEDHMIHRDIKGENIFLRGQIKEQLILGDLERVKKMQALITGENDVSSAGTYVYMAPEMIEASVKATKVGRKSDIWSFGCVMALMCSGGNLDVFIKGKVEGFMLTLLPGGQMHATLNVKSMLNVSKERDQLKSYIVEGGKPLAGQFPPKTKGEPIGMAELRDFLEYILQTDPKERPASVDLYSHAFMKLSLTSKLRASEARRCKMFETIGVAGGLCEINTTQSKKMKVFAENMFDDRPTSTDFDHENGIRYFLKLKNGNMYDILAKLVQRKHGGILKLIDFQYQLPVTIWERPQAFLFWEPGAAEYASVGDLLFSSSDTDYKSLPLPILQQMAKSAVDACHFLLGINTVNDNKLYPIIDIIPQVLVLRNSTNLQHCLKVKPRFPPFTRQLIPDFSEEQYGREYSKALFTNRPLFTSTFAATVAPSSASTSPVLNVKMHVHCKPSYLTDVLTQLAALTIFVPSATKEDLHTQLFDIWNYAEYWTGPISAEPVGFSSLPSSFVSLIKAAARQDCRHSVPVAVRSHSFLQGKLENN